jgi:hypothetical protein
VDLVEIEAQALYEEQAGDSLANPTVIGPVCDLGGPSARHLRIRKLGHGRGHHAHLRACAPRA